MKFGIALTRTHVALWDDATGVADELGYESVWLPDHLVFSIDMTASQYPGDGPPPVVPATPLFDCPAYLAYLGARTTRIRVGTFVYVYALRHPLVAARAFATADLLTQGRVEVGVGAGWLESEWRAVGLDFGTRGARLDEAIAVTRRLWTEDIIEHDGRFWRWEPLAFEPKPAQMGGPPLLVGGESNAALRRAATLGDGWMSMPHTAESIVPQLRTLRSLRRQSRLAAEPFTITVCCADVPDASQIHQFEALGVDRLIVTPWTRTRETLDGLRRFAAEHLR